MSSGQPGRARARYCGRFPIEPNFLEDSSMLKQKLFVTLIASAFAASVFAQAQPAKPATPATKATLAADKPAEKAAKGKAKKEKKAKAKGKAKKDEKK